jgi:uncharacterized repeat protein (TIGR01451 family)
MIRGLFLLVSLVLAPCTASAAGSVALESAVFVEKTAVDATGRPKLELRAAERVTPGDRLVFVVTYRNETPVAAPNVVITNPVPLPVAYEGSTKDAVVSIDGGKNWGQLKSLRVIKSSGEARAALPTDVTHIRWALPNAVAPGGSGRLTFRGTVK